MPLNTRTPSSRMVPDSLPLSIETVWSAAWTSIANIIKTRQKKNLIALPLASCLWQVSSSVFFWCGGYARALTRKQKDQRPEHHARLAHVHRCLFSALACHRAYLTFPSPCNCLYQPGADPPPTQLGPLQLAGISNRDEWRCWPLFREWFKPQIQELE